VARLDLPLIFFADNVIANSRLHFAQQWRKSGWPRKRTRPAGTSGFFVEFVEPDLVDSDEDAASRAAGGVLCVPGLGFRGIYQNHPEKVLWYMEQIFPRIRQWMDNDPRWKISDEAYRPPMSAS